jgi:hypothetical protein
VKYVIVEGIFSWVISRILNNLKKPLILMDICTQEIWEKLTRITFSSSQAV